jgi:hypothetical protein
MAPSPILRFTELRLYLVYVTEVFQSLNPGSDSGGAVVERCNEEVVRLEEL